MANSLKIFLKILIGFLICNTIYSIYFGISGNFPLTPEGIPQLTPETNFITIAFSLIIIGVFVYLVFFRGRKKAIDLKDTSQMLVGFFTHEFLTGFMPVNYLKVAVSIILICIFIYIGFFRK